MASRSRPVRRRGPAPGGRRTPRRRRRPPRRPCSEPSTSTWSGRTVDPADDVPPQLGARRRAPRSAAGRRRPRGGRRAPAGASPARPSSRRGSAAAAAGPAGYPSVSAVGVDAEPGEDVERLGRDAVAADLVAREVGAVEDEHPGAGAARRAAAAQAAPAGPPPTTTTSQCSTPPTLGSSAALGGLDDALRGPARAAAASCPGRAAPARWSR